MRTTLSALIFDVDGTLAETERDAHRVAFNETFAEFGLNWFWSEELYGKLLVVTGGKERIKFYWECYRADTPRPNQWETFITELHKKKTLCYNQKLARNPIPLRPGVQRLLTEARAAGIRLAIATTTNLDNVAALLHYSLSPTAINWFEVIAAGDVVKAKKPASDIYAYTLQQLQLPPTECIALEDSNNGLRAALGAKIPTVITVNDYTRQENFNGALLVVNHLGEPTQPATVLAGNVGKIFCVDVPLLRLLIA